MVNFRVEIFFALNSYLKQLGFESIDINKFLTIHNAFAEKLFKMFIERFSPDGIYKEDISLVKEAETFTEFKTFALILENLISKVIVRTNYFLDKSYISFKFNLSLFNQNLLTLPKPLTFREIFVWHKDYEGIHLRNGKIARGGIRWSDRNEDFRTEILGLVKTQNAKNTIIVPVGSKGGFVIKKQGLTREEFLKFGQEAYKNFLSGCLDITDNVLNDKIVTPKNIKIYEEQDPYLVVAADKGTANFSDIANEISKSYNFWLGDAFASGGSNGYNHKAMGITAKGAWVSVMRHFSEIGIDTQKDNFTVVGIGDMSGDVFGNGLLRSNKALLICAFNHVHIFIDPNPLAEVSFNERERLFNLPTSTWENYDLSKASKGAKIFKRSDAICDLTPEIKERFQIKENTLTPTELIKHILKSKFDLLWNGGIGTYVKASSETNEMAGDKANDVLRINGNELGAKIVGEGGNLGFTHKGRIEFEFAGGKINTDAVDNSAGVDCSDHEVNIKILLNSLASSGKITVQKKDQIIRQMEGEVEKLVLQDNFAQTLLLSLEKIKAFEMKNIYEEFVLYIEKELAFDRVTEKFPSNEEIEARYKSGKYLTKPDLAILVAYSKMVSYATVMNSNIFDDIYTEKFLINYFPTLLQQEFKEEVKKHQLSKEIIATVLSNRFVNYAGITFGFEVSKLTNKSLIDVIKAYFVAEETFEIAKIFEELEHSNESAEKKYRILTALRENILMPAVIKILKDFPEIKEIKSFITEFKEKIKSINAK